MISWLESIDRSILLFINGLNTPFLDELMWFFSGKLSLIPFYLILLYFLKKENNWSNSGLICIGVFLTVLISDQTSVHLFKEIFQRYRPSHNLEISHLLHYYEIKPGDFYRGGTYGFISSHAANYFGMLGFVLPLFSEKYRILKVIAIVLGIIVSLSRVYLGVHYPSDVFLGAALGLLIGWSMNHFIYSRFKFDGK
jgi:undecaprenyl-diphosphatase